jgi:hypothetical protein
MRVEQSSDGTWQVVDGDGTVLTNGMTNERAWAWLDEAAQDQMGENAAAKYAKRRRRARWR